MAVVSIKMKCRHSIRGREEADKAEGLLRSWRTAGIVLLIGSILLSTGHARDVTVPVRLGAFFRLRHGRFYQSHCGGSAVMMRADNKGEGGIMALLALALPKASPARVGRVGWVATIAVLGAALLYGDGIITPAISVLSAVEGLQVATGAFRPYIVPLTVAILVALFFFQRRGTGRIGKLFGPVMVTWFVTIGALGLYHVARQPAILGRCRPIMGCVSSWTMEFLGFACSAASSWRSLEARRFTRHGAIRPQAIRRAWLGLIYPALLLCYLGQGAALLTDPSGAERPFYALIPRGPCIYPAVVLASAATVIASQALISGVFSITHQAIRLGYFPEVAVRHTSGQAEGQTYVPLLNWSLALACIGLVVVFRQSSGLAAAYGLAVSGTMAITSIVYYKVVRHAWNWSRSRSLCVLLLFLSFDIRSYWPMASSFSTVATCPAWWAQPSRG